MHDRPNSGQEKDESPDSNEGRAEDAMWKLSSPHHRVPRVKSNCQHPKATGDVAHLHQPSLNEARRCWGQDVILCYPMPSNEEGERLLEIGDDEVEDQEEVLIIAGIYAIIFQPEDHAVGDEADQTEGAYSGDRGHNRNG